MNQRPDKLEKGCPYPRVEYLENVGWSQVFLPIYPAKGDVLEVESELCFTSLNERQAELSNVDPRLHWGVYDSASFYCGIGYQYTTNCGAADMEWHVFRIVSSGDDAGFWLDGRKTYNAVPASGVFVSTGLQLWRNLNSIRRCLNRKKWVRITINGKVVMHLLPVLDTTGAPALYDTVSKQLFYNTGEDALVAGPMLLPSGYTAVEYLEGNGRQYCSIPVEIDGSDTREFSCLSDIQFLGSSRQLMGFSTNACCYWGTSAQRSAYDLGGNITLSMDTGQRRIVNFRRISGSASLECGESVVTRTVYDAVKKFSAYGVLKPAVMTTYVDTCCARLYSLRMYEDQKLVRVLVPALDASGVCCLFDSVSGSSFYSEGEEAFIPGARLHST